MNGSADEDEEEVQVGGPMQGLFPLLSRLCLLSSVSVCFFFLCHCYALALWLWLQPCGCRGQVLGENVG
jgi:hypothetical protein